MQCPPHAGSALDDGFHLLLMMDSLPPPTPASKQIFTQQTLPALQLHVVTDLGNGGSGGGGWSGIKCGQEALSLASSSLQSDGKGTNRG